MKVTGILMSAICRKPEVKLVVLLKSLPMHILGTKFNLFDLEEILLYTSVQISVSWFSLTHTWNRDDMNGISVG